MNKTENITKIRMGQNARNFRLLNRMDTFQQKRKTFDQLDYLNYYSPEHRHIILNSMQAPIPSPLPQLSPSTISFYRRNSIPIFCTKSNESQEMEGHMTYESLWILSSLEEKQFQNYQGVVKQFEKNLPLYLSAHSSDIKQMAITAAGNKIIGKEQDIISIVQKDSRQMWVLSNHIYENKIAYVRLWPFIKLMNQFAFKTLFELTMLLNEPIQQIVVNKQILLHILGSFKADNQNIKKYAMRIIGNTIPLQDDFLNTLHQSKALDYLYSNLNCSNGQVRRDCCWVFSNICAKKQSATIVIKHHQVMNKLVELFNTQAVLMVKKQLTFIFSYLAHFADKREAFNLLAHPNVLEICYSQLAIEDAQINLITLRFIQELLELGDNFKYQLQFNKVLQMIQQAGTLTNQISNKSYSQNSQISSISLDIINFMQQQDDN